MKSTQTRVALPTAQGVRNPQRVREAGEPAHWAPNGVFVTVTSEAIRLRNHHIWVMDRERYARRKRVSESVAARAQQEQPRMKPRSHGDMRAALNAALDAAFKAGGAR